MSDASKNFYAGCITSENDLCKPLISRDQIAFLVAHITKMVEDSPKGEVAKAAPKPKLSLDLEHLQVTDYGQLGRVSEAHREHMQRLHATSPVAGDELHYLSLHSLFKLWHPTPNSNDDIELAAHYEDAVDQTLRRAAAELNERLRSPDALLPYWGRLAFLRVMSVIPAEQVTRLGLERVAVALIKRPKFNATTFVLNEGVLIGVNYALEPILKLLNRLLLGYFHSQQYAGPKRMYRALRALIPLVFHFWGDIALSKLHSVNPIFDEEALKRAQWLTADQIDFIIAHELGHVIFDHPRRLQALKSELGNIAPVRHEFEFTADTFADDFFRSVLTKRLCYFAAVDNRADGKGPTALGSIANFQAMFEGYVLLFTYMDFIDRCGILFKGRFGEKVSFRALMDSHPKPADRLQRLQKMHLSDIPMNTPLTEYAGRFFSDVLTYASGLDDGTLWEEIAAVTQ